MKIENEKLKINIFIVIYRLFRTFEADKTKNQKTHNYSDHGHYKELNGHTPKFGKTVFWQTMPLSSET